MSKKKITPVKTSKPAPSKKTVARSRTPEPVKKTVVKKPIPARAKTTAKPPVKAPIKSTVKAPAGRAVAPARKAVPTKTGRSVAQSPKATTKPAPKTVVKQPAKPIAKPATKPLMKPSKPVTPPKKNPPVKIPPAKSQPKKSVEKIIPKKPGKELARKPEVKERFKKPLPISPNPVIPEPAPLGAEDKNAILSKRTRKATPAIFKIKNRKNTPILFTLDDVRQIIDKKKGEETLVPEIVKTPVASVQPAQLSPHANSKKTVAIVDVPAKKSVHGAASVLDILGFNPNKRKEQKLVTINEEDVPVKWKKFYKQLIEMRNHLINGLQLHTKETLHRSSQDEFGTSSNYSQHADDAGSENFDRDFALSLVSSEQEALVEIDAAIRRIMNDTYGMCEITNVPIKKERLTAVPFTRYSLEGQRQLEKNKIKKVDRAGAFAEFGLEETTASNEEEE